MTCLASRKLVMTDEWKGDKVVVKSNIRPGSSVVAARTGLKAAPVRFIVRVAPDTAGLDRVRQRATMASRTIKRQVPAFQGKSARRRMIKRHIEPAGFVVATGAITTIAPPMHVVGAVAPDTGCGRLFQPRITQVALLTRKCLVSAQQRKPGLSAVIEAGRVPALLIVAGLAVAAPRFAVHIIRAMAADTVLRRTREGFIEVAAAAADPLVAAPQGKCGAPMVEALDAPLICVVTLFTVLPQRTLMRLGLTMAVRAGNRRLTMRVIRLMTPCTRHNQMTTIKREVRPGVVEQINIQPDNVGVPAKMLAVALLAAW